MKSFYLKGFIGLVTCTIIALYLYFHNFNQEIIQSRPFRHNSPPLLPNDPTQATRTFLSQEISTVISQTEQCLLETNLSDLFEKRELYPKAKENIVQVMKVLRRFVPRFSTPYDIPCWKLPIEVHRNLHNGKQLSGTIGGLTFSYTMGDHPSYRHMVNNIQWSVGGNLKRNIVCLPKVFLLGYPKCGSTFLYCILRKVLAASGSSGCSVCEATKEARWWVAHYSKNGLHLTSPEYLILYLLNFDKGAEYVAKSQPAVTIDASPNHMFETVKFSQNETMENYCLLPSLLSVVLPDSRYFVVMRNPVTMLYSAFWYSCTLLGKGVFFDKYKGPDLFHERITTKIVIFNECKQLGRPLAICVDRVAPNIYSPELTTCGKTRLEMSLYYFHAHKWLSVIPRERMHFFTMEELATQDLHHSAGVMLDFLELPSTVHNLPEKQQCNENTQYMIDYRHDPRLKMREDTQRILEEFFQPYNKMLANLLGDDKFLWK